MTFQYGDLRVDQLTFTSGGANQTVTVSGLVQQVTAGGTTSGSVRIEGDLVVTGTIEGNTITGNTINANTANLTNISGEHLNYGSGVISGLVVEADAKVSGNLGVDGTVTGFFFSAPTSLFGQVNVVTATGTTANFTTGNFQNLSGDTITGNTLNVTSGNFTNISGGTINIDNITITGDFNLPATGISVTTGTFQFISGNTITGNTLNVTTGNFQTIDVDFIHAESGEFGGNVIISGDLTVEGTITGETITGTTVNATTGSFQVIEGPVSTTAITGVTRIATAAEAASAVGPSGTYTDAISGNANSAFAINPSGLSSAMRAYDPPVGDSAGSKVFVRVVTTTGIAPDFEISGVTWSGIDGVDVSAVSDLQATSAVRPSGTYGVTASGSATSEFFYNPVQLEKTFKSYDPVATAAEDQLYARIVSGTSDGQGGFNTTSYGWIQVPTGTPSIATEAQAQAAAGASGTYSETPTAANIPNIINPNRLRSALQAYDPSPVSGERRVYARVVSGVTATEGDYEWLNVTDAVAGNFLPLSGGTVNGYTNFEAGLGVSGNVQITGNITQTGNHTTSGTYNASRASNAGQVLYQVNNSAGRGMFQGVHAGVAFAKGGASVAEFSVTGTQAFGVISGDLRVGGDAENVSNVNSSQFWALSGGQFVSAFSTNESLVWKDATQGDILKLQSNVGGQRSDQFIFSVSGDLTVTGKVSAQTGEFLTIDAFEENNGLIRSFSGDFHDLVVGNPDIYGAFLEETSKLEVYSNGIFHSGVFLTESGLNSAVKIYATAATTTSPNIVIGLPGVLGGATTRNSIAIGHEAQENASADSDRNIAIGNFAMEDMTDGHFNIAIGFGSQQNIRPGNNKGANVSLGDQAMFGNTASNNNGQNNIAIGRAALFKVLQAHENVAIGTNAGFDAVTVTGNIMIGHQALENAENNSNFNTALGWNAGSSLTAASGNTLLGASAGASINGSNNTIIGRIEGAAGFSDTIILGAGLTEKVRVANNEFTITPVDGSASILKTSGLTANRTYTFPNKDGTFAMLGDIPGGDSSLDLHNLSILDNNDVQVARISGDDGGSAMFASGVFNIATNGTTTVQGDSNNGLLTIQGGTPSITLRNDSAIQNGMIVVQSGTANTLVVNNTGSIRSIGPLEVGAMGGPDHVRISLNNDGSASFESGDVLVNTSGVQVGADPFGGTTGAQLTNTGLYVASTLNDGTILQGQFTGTRTSRINSVGTAEFKTLNLTDLNGSVTVTVSGSDGSASFASGLVTIESGDNSAFRGQLILNGDPNDGTNVGAKILGRGVIQATRAANEGTSAAFTTFVSGNSTPGTIINANGSAEFASGDCKIGAGGGITISGEKYISNRFSANDATYVSQLNGENRLIVNADGDLYIGETVTAEGNNATIKLEKDGSAEFSANIDASGITLGASQPQVIINRAYGVVVKPIPLADGGAPTDPLWQSYANNGSTVTAEIDANGSAFFASGDLTISESGNIAITSQTFTSDVGITLGGSSAGGGFMRNEVRMADKGGTFGAYIAGRANYGAAAASELRFGTAKTSTARDVMEIDEDGVLSLDQEGDFTSPNIQLNGEDGSASFASGLALVTSGGTFVSQTAVDNYGFVIQNSSANNLGGIYREGTDSTRLVLKDSTGATIDLTGSNGQGTFSGQVLVGDSTAAIGDNKAATIVQNGAIAMMNTTSDSSTEVFQAYGAGGETSVIYSDGSASFASGDVTISAVGQVSTSNDFRSVGGAIVTFSDSDGVRFAVRDNAGTGTKIALNNNGSATFASGQLDITAGGAISGEFQAWANGVAVDLEASNMWTFAGGTLANPSNANAGLQGLIFVNAALTGYGSNFRWPGTAPASVPATSVIPYVVQTGGTILLGTPTEDITAT